MSDTFKDEPPSMTELRALKQDDCTKWTPRDVLIAVLRQIDAGNVDITRLAVVFQSGPLEKADTAYYHATEGSTVLLGLLDRARMAVYATLLGID